MNRGRACLQCGPFRPRARIFSRAFTEAPRPTTAPKAAVDIKHIRENAQLHSQNCLDRRYAVQAAYPARIVSLFARWQALQADSRGLRERSNAVRRQLANPPSVREDAVDKGLEALPREQLLDEGRRLKEQLSSVEESESSLQREIEELALAMPNLTSEHTPRGDEPRLLSYINDRPEEPASSSDQVWRSHVHIGSELGLLDFAGAATSTGWGWYYLLNDAAQLEQALVQFALAVATRHGWAQVSPPSMVYSHIASACGFRPRDQNGEQQIYTIARDTEDVARGKPELCLAGTSEILLAGMKADAVLPIEELPAKRVAVSRCYRAEAGARGTETKGLYRVHEFTKVEMFAWTRPDEDETVDIFDEMLDIQTEILSSLGLHCRVLEMPTADLGASATRKCDVEAFFPSRAGARRDGFGEVTSASVCTDYQTRRLATRVKIGGSLTYPWTVNGTALAVPRVLAAILENGWDETDKSVTIPECLRPWMDGKEKIVKS